MKSYSISKEEPVIIYGGGRIGLPLANRLLDAGYNVTAIIDKNPGGVKGSSVPVMTAEEYYEKKGKAFVFISLVSGIHHFNLAKRLKRIGFDKLLFLPLYLRSSAAKNMIRVWNGFFCGQYNEVIPAYDELWNVSSDDFIIYEDDTDFVIVIVHKDYVRTVRGIVRENQYSDFLPQGTEISQPHFTPKSPIIDVEINDFLHKNLSFSNELTIFLNNIISFSVNDFFTYCSAPSSLNEKGYFNVIDGRHRTSFLVSKGFTGIPLRIKKNDWERYFRERKAQALMTYCRDMESLPFAVKHPAFILLPVEERNPDEKFVKLYNELINI